MDHPTRRSPIDEPPLRGPAQSLQERLLEVILDQALMPAVIALFLLMLWLQDLWRSYRNVPPAPWISGVMAAAALAYAYWRIGKAIRVLARLRLAIEGEKFVGQNLEELRTIGYAVYHDIRSKRSNVDHVVIGPAGVFTIETKTKSKVTGRKPRVLVDGERISENGLPMHRNPVGQARWQAKWISRILRRSTGRPFPVVPVIVFPGWYVERKSKPTDVYVLNDTELQKFLVGRPQRLSIEEIAMAKSHLEAFIRAQERHYPPLDIPTES